VLAWQVVFSGVLLVRAVMVPLSQPSITYIPPTNARFVALVDAELART
jgi:acyl-CoA synthetase (AMP-forming)/AMP-acid ligase II